MTVYLLGAGPGDPGLLTIRGAEVLSAAQVVIYDRLSQGAVLDMAPAQAELINVGKLPGKPRLAQDDINRLLIEAGRAHQSVVRLKGGDPLVFARGGEEAQALAEAGVDFEIIPGISSAFAVPAYAGIPVTLRHSSTSVTVITGHEAEAMGSDSEARGSDTTDDRSDPTGTGADPINWEAAAQLSGTLVILMGVARWPKIAERLMRAKLSPDTPVAAVSWGTRPNQRTIRSTLGQLESQPLQAPSVIVVGEVAEQNLAWFENLALFGRKVAVTRPAAQSSALSNLLRAQGAEPLEVPLIEIAPPSDRGAGLSDSLDGLRRGDYDWVVFTSANGVRQFMGAARDARDFGRAKVAAIGPATAQALRQCNIEADLVPRRFVAESLLEEFAEAGGASAPATSTATNRVLLARAEKARDVLPDGLAAKGWQVDVVSVYRTLGVELTDEARQTLADCDVITFMSPSAVEQYVAQCGAGGDSDGGASAGGGGTPAIACVGPITAQAARDLGLSVTVEASVHTAAGLVAALREHFGGTSKTSPQS